MLTSLTLNFCDKEDLLCLYNLFIIYFSYLTSLIFLRKISIADGIPASDAFYPVGLSAKVENISEEDVLQVRTTDRVEISDPSVDDDGIHVSFVLRPPVEDMGEDEQQAEFTELRTSLLRFVQGYQWGLWARGYILQRKNMNDMASALSEYLNLTPEEKYQILATDSVRERYTLIDRAINEFMEIAKVSSEAQEAQKGDQEQLYREAALKKQIDYLQKELDDMHPENISDVRKFEKKIQESGMNEEARKEAEKVLNRMRQEGKESHEYGLLYDYLDFVTSLSWKAPEFTPIDLKQAEEILDEDHYGLKKVKDRIIQQLAVMALNRKQYGSILLFVGAPSELRAPARPVSVRVSPVRSEENMSGSVLEGSGMRLRSADTAGPMWEQCPEGSWKL